MKKSSLSRFAVTVITAFIATVSASPLVAGAQSAQTTPTKPAKSATPLNVPQQQASGAATAPASSPIAKKNQPVTWLPDDAAIKTMSLRTPALPVADWGWNGMDQLTWGGAGSRYPEQRWSWLEGYHLGKLCLSSRGPSLQRIVVDTFKQFSNPKNTDYGDLLAIRNVIERSPEVSYAELTEAQLDKQLVQMGASGLKAKGFEAIRWTMPGNEVIYGVRGKDACVMQIKAQAPVRPSFQLLLEFSGVSSANYVSGKKLISEKHNVWPSRFAWADSINLRVVEAHANAEEFRGVYIMKGSFGVDNERISRLDVYQGKGIARIVMQPASLADVQRLGMDSVQSAFAPSQSLETSFDRHSLIMLSGPRNEQTGREYEAYFAGVNPITQQHWAHRYGSDTLKKKLPSQMYGVGTDAVSLRSSDRSIAVGIIPKKYWIPEYVKVLGSLEYLSFEYAQLRGEAIQKSTSLRMLPPKAGEGLAKGVSEYLFESEFNGNKAWSLLRLVTGPALPDNIVDVYSESIKLTDKEAAALAGRLNSTAKKVSNTSKK